MITGEDDTKLIIFPGVRKDSTPESQSEAETLEAELTSLQVLQAAIESGITDVVVAGIRADGTIYSAAEATDSDAIAGKFLRAANYWSQIEFLDDE